MNLSKRISLKALFVLLIAQVLIFQLTPVANADGPAPPNQNPGPLPSEHSAIISNGVVRLGVQDQGHLNVSEGGTVVGLRYVPTNGDGLSPGCSCEGWGAADANTGTTGYANVSVDGVRNMTLESFTPTDSTAISVVKIGKAGMEPTLRVTHAYHPSPESPFLYQVDVTVENISTAEIDLRYRRVMDWDVPPNTFNEYVTIQGTVGNPQVLHASNDGFATANPLGPRSGLGFTGDFADAGPGDHGALFDFGLGSVPAGQSKRFTLYYGAAGSEADALEALEAVKAQVYSLGEPAVGKTTGQPNTFIFGFTDKPAQQGCTFTEGDLKENYGVEVRFVDPIVKYNDCQKSDYYQMAADAVDKIASRFAITIWGGTLSETQKQQAFREIFGGNHIITFSTDNLCTNDEKGCNEGRLKPGTNASGATISSGAVIHIPTSEIASDRTRDWIIHEFGHLLTNPVCSLPVLPDRAPAGCLEDFNGKDNDEVFNFVRVRKIINQRAPTPRAPVVRGARYFNSASGAAQYAKEIITDRNWAVHPQAWWDDPSGIHIDLNDAELTADVFLFWTVHNTNDQAISDFMTWIVKYHCYPRAGNACGYQ